MLNFTKVATLEGRTVGLIRKAKHQSRVCDLDNSDNQWVVKTSELVDVRLRDAAPEAPAPAPSPEPVPAPPQPEAPAQEAPAPLRIEVKNVKVAQHLSMDSTAFTASVWIDGKRVGQASDDGHGGCIRVDIDRESQRKLNEYCASLPPRTYEDMPGREFPVTDEDIIGKLVDAYEQNQWTKRQCRKKTLFQLPGDAEGAYRTVLKPFSPAVKAFIVRKYGDEAQILNETL